MRDHKFTEKTDTVMKIHGFQLKLQTNKKYFINYIDFIYTVVGKKNEQNNKNKSCTVQVDYVYLLK